MIKKSDFRRELYIGDNLTVMRGLNSNTIDLIYLDPPFNSKSLYKGAMGSKAEKQQFSDVWKMSDMNLEEEEYIQDYYFHLYSIINMLGEANGESWHAYLVFMSRRLIEMRRILKNTGSIYLHCDPTMSAPLKLVMDFVFGKENFRNEIAWCYRTGGVSNKWFGRKHDVIFFYTKDNNAGYCFNIIKEKSYLTHKYGFSNVKIYQDKHGYYTETNCRDYWTIEALRGNHPENTGWATQKPCKLLERIITASSDKGGVALDPFCGCATACIVAERLNRQWIGIDIDKEAKGIMKDRATGQQELNMDWDSVKIQDITSKNRPHRTDVEIIKKSDPEIKRLLHIRQNKKCVHCGGEYHVKDLEIDRIVSSANGGEYTEDNIQLLCGNCNRRKGGGRDYTARKRAIVERITEQTKAEMEAQRQKLK